MTLKDTDITLSSGATLRFKQVLVFPGLINSHDHLDFNCFPLTGNRVYPNYTEWGRDIHTVNKENIRKVLQIPSALRIRWGLYKNLLNGITTVVHHGKRLPVSNDLIRVFQESPSLHSVQGEKHWRLKLNLRPGKQPVSIHIGEGTDKLAHEEINRLIKWNLFRRKLVGIHGVAMNEDQAEAFTALVWSPSSNYFLLGQTAMIDRLKQKTSILFGTDSTLTGSWNLWEQLRFARKQQMTGDAELFDMLTKAPAAIWGLDDYPSDIVVARPAAANGSRWDTFYSLNPENILLVLRNGQVRLFDEELVSELPAKDFYPVQVNGIRKYVYGDLPVLLKSIREYYPSFKIPVNGE